MSEYASETEQQLLIRQECGQASDVALTPTNVRRVYSDLRSPRRPTQRAMAQPHDDEPDHILSSLFNTGTSATMTAGVGVGTATPITVSAGTAPVGVRAPAVPRTSGIRTVSRGKEPRRTRRSRSRSSQNSTPSSDEQERWRVREEAARRFDRELGQRLLRRSQGGDGGGDDGDGSGGGGGGGHRHRQRDMHQNLDDLLNALRWRTGGRHITGITHTDTITTTYKDRRPPTVHRTSSRASGSEP